MTESDSAEKTPPQPLPSPESATATERPSSTARLVGVDLARALAVFGMFAVHTGPFNPFPTSGSGVGDWLVWLASGRASALFATLAGFSLVLIAGRLEPKTGLAGRQAKARIVIRAVILLVVGTALTMTDFGGATILNFYAVYFLLSLPLLRLRARTLALIAVALAVVTPQLAYALRALLSESIVNTIDSYDPIARLSGVGVLDFLLTGFYPAITWMTFVVTGMALGRLDLVSGAVRRRLAVVGPALIAFGYGVSWLALRLTGGAEKIMAGMPDMKDFGAMKDPSAMKDPGMAAGSFDLPVGSGLWGSDAWGLLAAEPHSGSTFDLVGCLGIAITVILGATVALDRLPWLRRPAAPVIAVGTMSLTLYVGHILAILALPGEAATPPQSASFGLLLCFIVGATVFAAVWSRFFRRGPLEHLLNDATKLARRVR
ncbi:heparan-alpha-glucosaminide N-acetyltransferase domain-containing protein [Streptomyces lincolnensis]|uniref:heparan-alpha-glucosaminide N-acetyltransferase domain-containing protein n=1 Tax=Streptomyces lincolnensis TaxID=1915 RepID=UPI001E5268BD|nr:heparan-alpha-glucosaminide N-acetyltransferase domain-containing protein [Streptomyces lincolnensis]MCD7440581.1 heparan-alpha-glucosaminide N-acetyltransferase domain-containing protein [Streptomyces lincolnensis]